MARKQAVQINSLLRLPSSSVEEQQWGEISTTNSINGAEMEKNSKRICSGDAERDSLQIVTVQDRACVVIALATVN